MPPMPEVEVMLDNVRRTLTGRRRFVPVPECAPGETQAGGDLHLQGPVFLHHPIQPRSGRRRHHELRHRLFVVWSTGQVLNDAGQGRGGCHGDHRKPRKEVERDNGGGRQLLRRVAGGRRLRRPGGRGFAAGRLFGGRIWRCAKGNGRESGPGKASFTARAFRSISGQVLIYDTKELRYVPVDRGAGGVLHEPGLTAKADPQGRYLFRDLAAGSYTISVQNEAQTPARTVQLGSQPVDLANVDFQISRSGAPKAPLPVPAPAQAKPEPPPDQPQPANPQPLARPQQHNLLGRELTASRPVSGSYRRADRSSTNRPGFCSGMERPRLRPA